MTLTFTVPRKPVSTNQMYVRRSLKNGGKGLMLSKNALDFKDAVHIAAWFASKVEGWPKIGRVKRVSLSITVWNTRHDCSAAEKLVADALEGVLYVNDKAAAPRLNAIGRDAGEPRVEITVELLEVA
jgi:Holliday junction resolvase RusA-like endonuclease